MKKLSLFLLGLVLTQAAMAQSCQSIFSTVQTAFDKSYREYQEFRKDAARLIFGDAIGDLTDVAIDFQMKLYDIAGTIPGNGEGSVGPRYITIPCKNIPGSLITDRTFISVPSLYDKLFITIEQTDGNSRANIAVCVKDSKGYMVNKKEKEQDGVGKKAEFVFYGTEDKYITIHLVKPVGPNKFEYKLTVTGEINAEKEDIAQYLKELEAEANSNTGTVKPSGGATTPSNGAVIPEKKPGIVKPSTGNGLPGKLPGIVKSDEPGNTGTGSQQPATPGTKLKNGGTLVKPAAPGSGTQSESGGITPDNATAEEPAGSEENSDAATGNRGRKGNGQKGGNKQQYKDKAITESKEKRQERKEENKQEAQKERAKDKALEKVKERKEAAEEETEETKKQKAKEKAREKVKEKKNAASTQGSN